ncbi:MAG: transcription termination/antitermination protein NusG [Caldimicrobium sp.]
MQKTWYSIQVWSGKEEETKEKFLQYLAENNLSDRVEKIFVPPPKEVEIVFSPERQVVGRFYSGFFLVYGEIDDELKEKIKSIEGVLDVVGGDKIYYFRSEEIEKLMNQLVVEEIKPKPKYQFMPGDKVKIIEGPFANFIGIVDEVKADKGKVRVLVSIFGRETPVDIDFTNLQKI